MKVKDLINSLSDFNPESDIVLKHRDGRDTVTNLRIRVFQIDNRAVIDGYEQEQIS
jgi:hypothetical protein